MTSQSRSALQRSATGRMARDWTQGSIARNLLSLSWPMTITQTLMSLGPTIDMIWVGKLGDAAVAAVGVSAVAVQLSQGVMMGFSTGLRALIARAIGAGDMEGANRVAQQAVAVSATYALFMALVGHFFGEYIIRFITQDPEIVRLGTAYLRIEFIGGATVTFRMMMDAIMQASGDSVNPMWIAAIYRVFHIILSPVLIFGLWIFPELGVTGAAFTGVFAQSLGVLLGLNVLLGAKSRVKLSFRGFHLDFHEIWRIIRIGFPASIAGIQRNLNQFFLQIFMAPFGAAALAAHVITQRLEMFIMMPAMSFGQGSGILVGQNLGAKKADRASRSAWTGVAVVEAFVITVAAAMAIWALPVVHVFSTDAALSTTGVQFVRIAAVGWGLMGFMFVIMQCLQGAGDTLPTMVIGIFTTWVVTLPLAYFLPQHTSWGASGIRWAMTASVVIGAIANVTYFRMGKWKTRRV